MVEITYYRSYNRVTITGHALSNEPQCSFVSGLYPGCQCPAIGGKRLCPKHTRQNGPGRL